MRRVFIGIVVLVLATGVLPDGGGVRQAAAQDSEAFIRLGHFSPGMGEIELYLDRQLVEFGPLRFGSVTDWSAQDPGSYRVTVTRSGAPLAEALLDTTVTLEAGQRVTLAIIGEVIRGTAVVFPLVEDYSPIEPGLARVTVLHAVPDLGLVDIHLNDGSELVQGLTYPGTATSVEAWDGSARVEVIGGARTLAFEPADTPGMMMLNLTATFAADTNNLLVLAGLRASPVTVQAVTVPETEVVTVDGELIGLGSGEASVRAGNFASGAGELDVFVDGEPFGGVALAFGDSSAWATLPAGLHEIAVASAGTSYENAIIVAPEVPVATGSHVTLAVVGLIPADGGQIYPVVEDASPVGPGEARLTVLHAMPDLGPVNVVLDDGTPLFVALDFPGIDGPPMDSVNLVAGTRDLQLTPFDDSGTLALDLPNLTLAPGTRNLVVVAGLRANPALVLLVDDAP